MFSRRKERARQRAECKKILEKQLQLLSEYSEKCAEFREMDSVARAMIEIAGFLCSIR